jgi:hypothetical protein
MTVPSEAVPAITQADGVTTDFPVPFPVIDPDELRVLLQDPGGAVQELAYTLLGDGPDDYVARITPAPEAGSGDVVRVRDTRPIQPTSLRDTSRLPASAIELALDRATLAVQDLNQKLDRAPLRGFGQSGGQVSALAAGLLTLTGAGAADGQVPTLRDGGFELETPAGGGDTLKAQPEKIPAVWAGGNARSVEDLADTPLTGLVNGIQLHLEAAGRTGVFMWRGGNQLGRVLGALQAITAINAGTDVLTIAGHGLYHAMMVRATDDGNGLTAGERYYVEYVGDDEIRLHHSYGSIWDQNDVVDVSGAPGTLRVRRVLDPLQGHIIAPSSSPDGTDGVWMREGDGRALDINPSQFGALTNNNTDATEAIQAAYNYAQARNGVLGSMVRLPGGRFRVSRTLYFHANRIGVWGQGQQDTYLYRTEDYGDTVVIGAPNKAATRLSSLSFGGMQLYAEAPMESGAHLVVSDVIFFDCSNIRLHNGFIGMDLYGIQGSSFRNFIIKQGSPAALPGSRFIRVAEPTNPINESGETFFSDFNCTGLGTNRVDVGLEITKADGLWFSNGHIGPRTETNVLIRPHAADATLVGLLFNNVWFDGRGQEGIVIEGNTSGSFGNFRFTGCQQQSRPVLIRIDPECVNLRNVEFNGGYYGNMFDWNSAGSGNVAAIDIGAGRDIMWVGVTADQRSAPGPNTQMVRLRSGVQTFSWTGGSIGGVDATGAPSVGIQIDSVTAPHFNITGVSFLHCGQDITYPQALRSKQKITGCTSLSDVSAHGTGQVSSGVLNLRPLADTVMWTGTASISGIAGGWDGRRITIYAEASSALTLQHNTGTAPNRIRTHSQANVTIPVGASATLVYNAEHGTWFAESVAGAPSAAPLGSPALAVSSGVVTATQGYHSVNTGSAPQTVTNIAGGVTEGQMLILRASSSANALTVTHSGSNGATNVRLAGGANFVSTSARSYLVLIYAGAAGWVELSRQTGA